jgi:hypothetical protein
MQASTPTYVPPHNLSLFGCFLTVRSHQTPGPSQVTAVPPKCGRVVLWEGGFGLVGSARGFNTWGRKQNWTEEKLCHRTALLGTVAYTCSLSYLEG